MFRTLGRIIIQQNGYKLAVEPTLFIAQLIKSLNNNDLTIVSLEHHVERPIKDFPHSWHIDEFTRITV